MKTIKKTALVLCLALALCFVGCAAQAPTNENTATEDEKSRARIAELESELQKVKEEKYIAESQLTQEIAKLKDELAKLTSKDEPDPEVGSRGMIFHYKVEDGGATITGFEGAVALVQIPATLDGYAVKKIGERAFEGNTALAAVVVPDSVSSIDWFAFYNCSALQDITIPASVTLIGHAVFDGCNDLTVVCPTGSYAETYAKSYGISYVNK
ncbi:MAG: leucine-rich repeat protein [Clostridia bacterium]|nr:leucine-rich repeat protein [Clostridia bacterium]